VQIPNPATVEVQNYALEADSFIEALLKISAQFHLPMGVEWVKTADTLKPIQLPGAVHRSRRSLIPWSPWNLGMNGAPKMALSTFPSESY
jgi:hypothetical protein